MSLKSISSFLASILLIGFTISTGIIVYYFVSTLPRTQTQQVSSQASKVLSCAGATFDVKVRNCNLLNGLVLWLPMDEGSGTIAYDYSGNGNNGTLYNGTNICSSPPTSGCPTWVDGVIGKAISFDGVDDYVQIPPSTSLDTTEAITMVAWVRLNPGGADVSYDIIRRTSGYEFYVGRDDGKVRIALQSGTGWYTYTSNSSIARDGSTWYHIVGTWDKSTGKVKIYINGSLDATRDGITTSLSPSGNFYVGGFGTSYSTYGLIDEVLIYNRVLTDDEIKQLYYEGLTNKFNITIGLLNSGYADLGNSFTAIVYLKNGTILQLPLVLDNNLSKGYYLEKTLTIDGYYPSYGLIDKIMVCSNDCQGVCYELKINNQC